MFTTLTHIKSKRLLPKFISEELEYKGFTYYSTRLYSKKNDNIKIINKFKKRIGIPIVFENCLIVLQYKMIILANSVLTGKYNNIGIIDKDGQLPFLLPFISEKCGSISVFTENATAYTNIENELLENYGTPIIKSSNINTVLKGDIIFADKLLKNFKENNIYTLKNTENRKISLPFSLPYYADEFCIAAGLFYYGNFKELGKISFIKEEANRLRL